VSVSSRPQRILQGWSANLVQLLLGITQQVALIPVFLHFWTSDTLAAWLALYAAGNFVLIADAGLQLRAINRFRCCESISCWQPHSLPWRWLAQALSALPIRWDFERQRISILPLPS